MSDEIQVHTDYTHDEWKAFQRYTMRRVRWIFYVYSLLWLLYIITKTNREYIFEHPIMYAIYVLVGIIMWSYTAFLFGAFTKRIWKRYVKTTENGETILFYETKFSAESQSEEAHDKTLLSYSQLHKVVETNRFLYLYRLPRLAYIVNKSNLSPNEMDVVRTYITNSVKPRKYERVFRKV